jgi:Uma2 family endonuclease
MDSPALLDPDATLVRSAFDGLEIDDRTHDDAEPPRPPTGRSLDPDEMLLYPEFEKCELIDGIPVEKDVSNKAEALAGELQWRLSTHCRPGRVARVFNSNIGYCCFPHRPRLVRKPDVSVVLAGRFPNDELPEGWYDLAPDIAVEVHSPTDRAEGVEERVSDYRQAGVKLVWLISPRWRTAVVRRLDGTATEVTTLSGDDVLPGFNCPVAELFV